MSSAEGYVLPKPGIPKTLGILNIIFGVVLVLVGLCTITVYTIMPMALQSIQDVAKKAQAKEQEQRKANLKNFDERAAAAKNDEEKKVIEAEKDDYIASNPDVPDVDINGMTGIYQNPTIMGFQVLQGGTGVVMNIALIVAGVGLIKLSSWGRKMALTLAAIQIVRLGILTSISILVVQPETVKETNKMMANLQTQIEAQQDAQNKTNEKVLARLKATPKVVVATPEKTEEKTPEKAAEKTEEKAAEKAAEKTDEKTPEKTEKAEEKSETPPVPANPAPVVVGGGVQMKPAQTAEMGRMMALTGSIGAALYFVFGSIYPIVTLILLNLAGARAACQTRKSPASPEFLS